MQHDHFNAGGKKEWLKEQGNLSNAVPAIFTEVAEGGNLNLNHCLGRAHLALPGYGATKVNWLYARVSFNFLNTDPQVFFLHIRQYKSASWKRTLVVSASMDFDNQSFYLWCQKLLPKGCTIRLVSSQLYMIALLVITWRRK